MRIDHDFRELFSYPNDLPQEADAQTRPRAATLLSVKVTSDEGEISAACLELSTGGAYLRVSRLIPTGASVQLDIDLPGDRISVHGVVRTAHIDEDGLEGIGVQLVDASPQVAASIVAYCAARARVRSGALPARAS